MFILYWQQKNKKTFLLKSESPHGIVTNQKSHYHNLLEYLITRNNYSPENLTKPVKINFIDFFDTDVKSVEKYCSRHYGKTWLEFEKFDHTDLFKLKIPSCFWISVPNFKPLLNQNNYEKTDSVNILSTLFRCILKLLGQSENGLTIHKGSFLSAFESREVLLKNKGEKALKDFYLLLFENFIAELTVDQLDCIENYFAVMLHQKIKIRLNLDKHIRRYFLESVLPKPDFFHLYFAWLFSFLIKYLSVKEIRILDSPLSDIDDASLFDYERERSFQLLQSRIKVTKSQYDKMNDFRCLTTETYFFK